LVAVPASVHPRGLQQSKRNQALRDLQRQDTHMQPSAPDRLRQLIDTILNALDERIEGDALAKRAYLSRFHFDRLVRRGLGEAPTTLLEPAGGRCRFLTTILYDKYRASIHGCTTRWVSRLALPAAHPIRWISRNPHLMERFQRSGSFSVSSNLKALSGTCLS
jgi:AraC-like DNA-binding protein